MTLALPRYVLDVAWERKIVVVPRFTTRELGMGFYQGLIKHECGDQLSMSCFRIVIGVQRQKIPNQILSSWFDRYLTHGLLITSSTLYSDLIYCRLLGSVSQRRIHISSVATAKMSDQSRNVWILKGNILILGVVDTPFAVISSLLLQYCPGQGASPASDVSKMFKNMVYTD